MFLNISILVCSVLCIIGFYFTIAGFLGLASTGSPTYRILYFQKMMYGSIIRVSIVIYWLIFVEKFKVLVSVISLSPGIVILSMIILSLIYEVVKDLYVEKINKKENSQ